MIGPIRYRKEKLPSALAEVFDDVLRQIEQRFLEAYSKFGRLDRSFKGTAPAPLGAADLTTGVSYDAQVGQTYVTASVEKHSVLYEFAYRREHEEYWKYLLQVDNVAKIEVPFPNERIIIKVRYKESEFSLWSDWSEEVSICPPDPSGILPKPTGIQRYVDESNLSVRWDPLDVNEYPSVAGYQAYITPSYESWEGAVLVYQGKASFVSIPVSAFPPSAYLAIRSYDVYGNTSEAVWTDFQSGGLGGQTRHINEVDVFIGHTDPFVPSTQIHSCNSISDSQGTWSSNGGTLSVDYLEKIDVASIKCIQSNGWDLRLTLNTPINLSSADSICFCTKGEWADNGQPLPFTGVMFGLGENTWDDVYEVAVRTASLYTGEGGWNVVTVPLRSLPSSSRDSIRYIHIYRYFSNPPPEFNLYCTVWIDELKAMSGPPLLRYQPIGGQYLNSERYYAVPACPEGKYRNLIIWTYSNNVVRYELDEITMWDYLSGDKRSFLGLNTGGTRAKIAGSIDIIQTGAGGRDGGNEQPNTWYYIWLIGKDDGTVSGLFSTSSSKPTLPSDYRFQALVGAIRNDGSSNFVAIRQHDNEVFLLSGPLITSTTTSGSWTGLFVAGYFPPIARTVRLAACGVNRNLGFSPYSGGFGGEYFAGDASGTATNFGIFGGTARGCWFTFEIPYVGFKASGESLGGTEGYVYYYTNVTSQDIYAIGWRY